MIPPSYLHLTDEDMPRFTSKDNKIDFKLVAGSYNEHTAMSIAQSPVLILWAKTMTDGKSIIDLPKNFRTSCYIISGKARFYAEEEVEQGHLVVFENEVNQVEIEINEPTEFLILSGEPIGEEVTKSGPFVMNTQTEIMEAMRDYQMGKMGILIENEL
jgi:redox-sensitive bicupin YhaK (pirin superfamily)